MKRNLTSRLLPATGQSPSLARVDPEPLPTPLEHFEKLLTEDLHDSVCQSLAGTSFLVNLLCRRAKSGKTVQADDLQKVAAFLSQAMEDLRGLISPESLGAGGLAMALDKFAAEMSLHAQRHITVEAEPGEDSPRTTLVLYRMARWGVRHAIKSTDAVKVRLSRHEGAVTLEVDGADAMAFLHLPKDELAFLRQYARIASLTVSVDSPGRTLRIRSLRTALRGPQEMRREYGA